MMIRFLLSFVLQVAVFICVQYLGHAYATGLPGHQRHDLSWGISLRLAMIIFCILAFIVAAYANMLFSQKNHLIISVAAFIMFSLFWLKDIDDVPYRVSLLLVSALSGFLAPVIAKAIYCITIRKYRQVGP